MTKKILINATQAEELRVAIVDNKDILFDLDIESSHLVQKKANIYKAKVSRIEHSLNAIFVNYGAERHGFLPMKELAPEYLEGNKIKLKEGQDILIQIEKEERGNKGAAVTTFISLAGCYLVLMPNSNKSGGVSRRIEGEDRQQLKGLLADLTVPAKMSVIARTACLGRTQEELQWDLDSLLKLWDTIGNEAEKHAAPFLIYQESDVIMRSIRDYLRQDIDEILVDERKTYERVLQHVKTLRPDFEERVRFYHHDIGLFTYYRIESQIETAFLREVKLPSGGVIVIDHTEALTSIDINSSKSTKGGDIEETAFQTNLEASREIARQMKLRDVGGLLVIDFIDMENSKNQRLVEEELEKAIKGDRARIQLGKISRFGLLELSRQRLRPSLEESSSNTCPRCNGQGTIRGVESTSLSIIRLIQEEAMRADTHEIHVELPIAIMVFLGNEKRHLITQVEVQNKVRIILIPNPNLESPNYTLTRVTKSSEESKASYQLQPALIVEPYERGLPKAEIQEQPAIRALTIEKAPTAPSSFKRTLTDFFAKVQALFAADEKSSKSAATLPARQSSEKRERTHGRRGDRPDHRGGEKRRNNGNNERRNHRNGPAEKPQQTEARTEQRLEPTQASERKEQQNPTPRKPRPERPAREARPPREAMPRAASPAKAPAPPLVVVEAVTAAPIKAPHAPQVISPQVQAILNSPSASSTSKQVESTATKPTLPKKMAREEVLSKIEFSMDEARDIVKKQHEKSGERVETTEKSANPVNSKTYNKQEQVI